MIGPSDILRPLFLAGSSGVRARRWVANAARISLVRGRSLALWLDLAAIGLLVRVATVLARPLTYSPLGYDEKFYVYGGYSVLHGQVPYRDFQNLKGPLVSLTEALGVYLFGLEDERFRLLPLSLGVGSLALFAGALIQRGVHRVVAIGMGLLVVSIWLEPSYHDTGVNDTESILLAYFMLAIACLTVRTKIRAPFLFLGGFFLCATALVKENFVITAAATWLTFLFMPAEAMDPKAERLAYIRWTVAGGLSVGLAVAGYLALAGGLLPYFRLIKVYPKYASTYCTTLNMVKFHDGPFWSQREQEFKYLTDNYLTPARVALWLPFFAATTFVVNRRNAMFALGAGVTFLAVLATINIGHCYHNHYWVLGATGFTVFALPGAVAVSDSIRFAPRIFKTWAGTAMLAAVACSLYPRYKKLVDEHPRPVKRAVAADVQEAIDRYSKPLDYILTTGTPDLYFLTGRLGAHETNGFVDELLVMYPGDTDEERVSGMRVRLEADRPNVVIIDSSNSAYPERSKRTIHSLVDAYLDAHHYLRNGRVYVRPDLVDPNFVETRQSGTVGDVVADAK